MTEASDQGQGYGVSNIGADEAGERLGRVEAHEHYHAESARAD